MPRLRSSFIERLIERAVQHVVRQPKTTLLLAGIVLVVSVLSSMRWLTTSSDDDRLFSRKLQFRADFADFDEKFPENDALYILIEDNAQQRGAGSGPTPSRWIAAADAVVAAMKNVPSKYIDKVDSHVPLDKLGSQGLLFDTAANLRGNFNDVKESAQLAKLWAEKNPSFPGVPAALSSVVLGKTPIGRFLTGFTFVPEDKGLPLVKLAAGGWLDALEHPDKPIAVGSCVPDLKQMAAETPEDFGYYWQVDQTDPRSKSDPEHAEHLLLVRIYPKIDYSTLDSSAEPVVAIRQAMLEAAKGFPEFHFGLTGRPAMDADEMSETDRDSHVAETMAAIVVFIGLLLMLKSLWLAIVAELSLAVGVGWTFGWATISVGELNLLSIVFLIALIGIGMDYLVQILSRYRVEAMGGDEPEIVWERVFQQVAAPINTACFGAASAFLVSLFTNFRGAAQLGIIAGGGLILCLLAGYTVMPALLTLFPLRSKTRPQTPVAAIPLEQPKQLGARWLIFPAAWLCMLGVLIPWGHSHFDSNILNLQAPNLESCNLVHKLQPWFSVVLSKDLDQLRKVRAAVTKCSLVDDTDSILSAEDNYQWLLAHQSDAPKIQWSEPEPITSERISVIAGKADALAARLKQFQAASGPTTGRVEPMKTVAEFSDRGRAITALEQFAAKARNNPTVAAERISAWQTVFVAQLKSLLGQFSPQSPPDLKTLPPEMADHFISRDGTYALYISPKPNLDLWNRDVLRLFVRQVNSAVATVPGSPRVTGPAPSTYYTTHEVRHAFDRATSFTFFIIFTLVLLDLKNIWETLLAIGVLALGLPLLIELMGRFNINWNFANFFGLPILIGAGHEYGVFMVHRYREALRDPQRAWRGWDVADRALLLCAYITTSSFGFFWLIAHHRGLKSLGQVMAIGTACIYLAAVLALRPILRWQLERAARAQEANPEDEPAPTAAKSD